MVQEILSKPVSETSRLSGLAVEKFLMPNEIFTYATRSSLYIGKNKTDTTSGFKGYVTKNRVIFYKRDGLIIKNDRLNEIPLDQIKSYRMVEQGLIFKDIHLELNELQIKGERSDVLELYRAIQAAKQK